MKAIILLICLAFEMSSAYAQIIKPKAVVKNKAENRANSKVDNTLDKGLDKVEEGIGNIFKKKDKKSKTSDADNGVSVDEAVTKGSAGIESSSSGINKMAPLSVYSKFDFVPGEKIIAYEDFSNVSLGDFPTGWNTNSTAEVVKLDGSASNWLFMSKDGYFQPEAVKDLPVNFTLEFDAFTRFRSNNILNYQLFFIPSANPRKDISEEYPTNYIQFRWLAGEGAAKYYVVEKGETISQNEGLTVKDLMAKDLDKTDPVFARISIWRQNSRLRLYVNENKVLDIPQAFDPKQKYNMFKFGTQYMNFSTNDDKDEFMVANIRYAVGAPDTRSKLITEGKLVTTGILFAVNSANILPNSYGTLKEIATVLKENPTVHVKIVGHTDSDGDDATNLTLSKQRAAAVKESLQKEFGIDGARMQTDGKGEAVPVGANTTSVGKAGNRRVEIIKL